MRVVVAPDKFKGCLPAAEVAAAVARGIRSARPGAETVLVPVADGGDGTVAAALSAGWAEVVVDAVGPTGEPVRATYARQDQRAVVELAEVVGLDRLPGGRLDPLGASTFGLGLVIRDAVEAGVTEVVLGLGGSASTDGGAGMVQALGARLLDAAGRELPTGAAALTELEAVDLEPLRTRLGAVAVTVATDVDSPLLGPDGAAAVFGPQKGAGRAEVAALEQGLTRWAQVVSAAIGQDWSETPGAGAAGGTGFAALALLGADRASGHRGGARAGRVRRAGCRSGPGDHRRGLAGPSVAGRKGPGRAWRGRPRRTACRWWRSPGGAGSMTTIWSRPASRRRTRSRTWNPTRRRASLTPPSCWR